jgi:hypothetical protein
VLTVSSRTCLAVRSQAILMQTYAEQRRPGTTTMLIASNHPQVNVATHEDRSVV